MSDTRGQAGAGQCFGLRIDGAKNKDCQGITAGDGAWKEFNMRAVKYAPRPVGVSASTDVYTPKYHFMHKRDLDIIANVMKANTIRLDPWDIDQDHADFLQLCQDLGLFVIPTFDFKQYADPRHSATDDDIREKLGKDFGTFLGAANDTNPEDSPILAWSINFGMQLNSSVQLGVHSLDFPSHKLKAYFARLCMVRHIHRLFEYDNKEHAYRRPLAIPLDLNTRKNVQDIGWFVGFVETNWGSWPDCPFWNDDPRDFGAELGYLRKQGSFDIWIAEGLSLSRPSELEIMASDLSQVNGTIVQTNGSVQWPDTQTRSEKDAIGTPYDNCISGGCSYPTRKAVVVQFGFTSLDTQVTAPAPNIHATNATAQQETLQKFWHALHTGKLDNGTFRTCAKASGGIVDEWMDDWDRNAQANCLSDPYHHGVGEECAKIRQGDTVYPEWLGVNAQYSFFTKHCISARVTSGGGWFCFDSADDKPCQLESSIQDGLSKCVSLAVEFPLPFRGQLKNFRLIIPNWQAGILLLIILMLLRFVGAFCQCLKKLCCCRPSCTRSEDPDSMDMPDGTGRRSSLASSRAHCDSNTSLATSMTSEEDDDVPMIITTSISGLNLRGSSGDALNMEMPRPRHREEAIHEEGGRPRLHREASGAAQPEVVLEVPEDFRSLEGPNNIRSFKVTLSYKEGSKSMNPAKARIFLLGHSEVQSRRLRQQIEAEYLALLAKDRSLPRDRLMAKALENIHARTMEGYLVWLESHAWPLSSKKRLHTQLMEGQRPSAKLYIDAVLLRIVESLSEQIIHAPEFIDMCYNKVRFPNTVDEENGEELIFNIDIDQLQAGIDMMNENGNPYDRGINFDDINDCGFYNRETIKKTFRESPSVLVVIDCLSNFSPVFTVKMWIFMMAWMFHHKVVSLDPTLNRMSVADIGMQLMTIDAIALLAVEMMTFLLGMYQKRCVWRFGYTRWIVRRVVYSAMALVGIFLSFFQAYNPLSEAFVGFFPAAYWSFRFISFKAMTRKHSTPFLSGVPKSRGGTSVKKPYITKVRWLIWLCMLLCCFLFETFLVVPLSSGFHFNEFCLQACSLNEHPSLLRYLSSTCMACSGALSFIWLIVSLTAFFDIYYFFYLGTAIVGYGMGVTRGLNNILSTAQRNADMSSDSDAYARIGGVGRVSTEMSEGNIMREVYGLSWRMVWSRIAESFYNESLISEQDANTIVKAAGTARWKEREENYDKMVLPTDRFAKLHFIPHSGRNGSGNSFSFQSTGPAGTPGLASSSFGGASIGGSLQGGGSVLPSSFGSSSGVLMEGPCISSLHVRTHKGTETKDFDISGAGDLNVQGAFTVTLEPPCPVYEMYFRTAQQEEAMDPTHWSLKGETHDGKEKVLIRQKETREMANGYRLPRFSKVGPFLVEQWRKDFDTSDSDLRLDTLPAAAAELLSFFTVSLKTLLKEGIDPTERLLECSIGSLPTLTQIIPSFNETVINSEKSLIDEDGVQSNLAFIISQYPGEWDNLAAKLRTSARELFLDFISRTSSADHVMEVRLWAAMRSQTVAKTVAGAIRYHEVLGMIPKVEGYQPRDFMKNFHSHAQVGQLIIAHQTFGKSDKDEGNEDNDQSLLQLLEMYREWPVYLAFDFDSKAARKPVSHLVEHAAVDKFKPIQLKKDFTLRYASALVRYSPSRNRQHGHKLSYQDLQVIELLPRRHPLLIGTPNFKSQGKAGNQLNALRFAGGHYIQMMDANMGASFSEACKVPFILKMFQPAQIDRRLVKFRILGFREFIFTEHHGAVGGIMASAESSFGTICQRFLAGLDVRMHYGHPDFIDAFWASNRGSLSKASPAINLSEDIFAGFNARMRGERSEHSDALAWEKGRETSFNTSSMFFYKVSTGNVGVMRSRDLKILCERLNIADNLSFYFASIGFYLNNWLIDMSIKVYLFVFVLLTLASKTLEDVGKLGSLLASEWIVSMGIIATLPRFAELILEYGCLEGFCRFFKSVLSILIAFTFINKSIASGVSTAMVTGEGNYIATGRPNANTHFSWRECYFVHCQTHYYPALNLLMWYLVYHSITYEHETSALPMFIIVFTAMMWLIAPMLFCPQPRFTRLQVDMREYWKFVVATPKESVRGRSLKGLLEDQLRVGYSDQRSTLYEMWLARALEHKRRSKTLQAGILVWNFVLLGLLVGLSQVGVFIGLWDFFVAFICHCVLIMVWEAFGRPEALMLFAFLSVFLVPYLFMPDMLLCDYLLALLILIQCLCVIKQAVLLVCRLYPATRPNMKWPEMPSKPDAEWRKKKNAANRTRRYDMLVEYFFINFMEYEIHLLCALFILILNLITQLLMVLLDWIGGLHSWFLLNRNLGLELGTCGKRRKYEPGHGQRSTRGASQQGGMQPTEIAAWLPQATPAAVAAASSLSRPAPPAASTASLPPRQGEARREARRPGPSPGVARPAAAAAAAAAGAVGASRGRARHRAAAFRRRQASRPAPQHAPRSPASPSSAAPLPPRRRRALWRSMSGSRRRRRKP